MILQMNGYRSQLQLKRQLEELDRVASCQHLLFLIWHINRFPPVLSRLDSIVRSISHHQPWAVSVGLMTYQSST